MYTQCVHLCRVAGKVTLRDPIWQVTLRSCETVFREQQYIYLYLFNLLSKLEQCTTFRITFWVTHTDAQNWTRPNLTPPLFSGLTRPMSNSI